MSHLLVATLSFKQIKTSALFRLTITTKLEQNYHTFPLLSPGPRGFRFGFLSGGNSNNDFLCMHAKNISLSAFKLADSGLEIML